MSQGPDLCCIVVFQYMCAHNRRKNDHIQTSTDTQSGDQRIWL